MQSVELWEDNAGGLYLRYGDRVFAGLEQVVGASARDDMDELWQTRGAVNWCAIEEYSRALTPGLLDHPETRLVATYDGTLHRVGAAGNAARRYLGADAGEE
jgi:hypothetical protein